MRAKLPVRLRVLIPAAENSIAGNAFRPGDVLTSRNGMTVEIGNTDAEGRLIMPVSPRRSPGRRCCRASVDGLLLAHEWLDNVPCHVVEVDDVRPCGSCTSTRPPGDGVARAPRSTSRAYRRRWRSGSTRGGRSTAASPAPAPRSAPRATGPGRTSVRRVGRGLAIAVDYGHTRDDRPPFGSLRSYRTVARSRWCRTGPATSPRSRRRRRRRGHRRHGAAPARGAGVGSGSPRRGHPLSLAARPPGRTPRRSPRRPGPPT